MIGGDVDVGDEFLERCFGGVDHARAEKRRGFAGEREAAQLLDSALLLQLDRTQLTTDRTTEMHFAAARRHKAALTNLKSSPPLVSILL